MWLSLPEDLNAMNRVLAFAAFLMLASTTFSHAALHTERVEYTVAGAAYEGYLAYDDAIAGRRPAVLVVHDWMGVSDNTRRRADQLAALGYVAFAVDMYGKGRRPTSGKEAGQYAGALKADRAKTREGMNAALQLVRGYPFVDSARIAAIGYCFGGTCALELARDGADIRGVVSFHGGLDTPHPEATHMRAKVLVLHGADDPHVPPAQVAAFEEEMRKAGADWQLVAYGGAVHAFTVPSAGNDPSRGAAYNADADRRSWTAMRSFFDEVFK